MSLLAGMKLGPYEIVSPLGAGGMGEVYRARDTRLDRDVAIKVLPEALARDKERIARFQREAKVLASLNHPNIAAIFGFEEADKKNFLVMELVEGETLAEGLARGAMPVEDALDVAKQIAEALEAAHDKGIIHRDLKPANVKVSPEGRVKVLDFGLAKALTGGDESSPSGIANSPTITADFTRPGVILGTAAYMSPEQARGKPLDKRTDIWSFGCMLYEFLTGARIFGGETTSDAIGAILHKEPDWAVLPPNTPPTIQLLLRRCLTKDRNQRLRDIGDARIEIQNAINDPTASSLGLANSALSAADHTPAGRGRAAFRVIAALAVAVAAAAAWKLKPVPELVGPIRTEIRTPTDGRILYVGDSAGPAVVSPDGTMIAFVAQQQGSRQQIWLRRLQETEPRPMRGTDRAGFPFWSPDSKSLGFFAKGKLKRVDVLTGTATTICDAPGGRGGAWMTGDVIVLAPDFQNGLFRVSAAGGTPVRVTDVDPKLHTSHRWPADIGDANHFLFTAINHDPAKSENAGIYLGSLDGAPPRRIVGNFMNAQYALGHMLFVRDTVLIAAPLDLSIAALHGDFVPIASDVTPDLSTWHAAFSVSQAGVLAYHRIVKGPEAKEGAANTMLGGGSEANVVAKYDRTGQVRARIAEGTPQLDLRIGPNDMIAISVVDNREFGTDIWVYGLGVVGGVPPDPSTARRVTSLPFVETAPVWSPDGTELAFSHMFVGNASDAIYRKTIGGGVEHKLVELPDSSTQIWPVDWSSDGKYLVYVTGTYVSRLGTDIHVLPLDGGASIPLLATGQNECYARVSPNGKWMAYRSGSADHTEVYVVPFNPESGPIVLDKNTGMPAELWQISVGGGTSPCWRGDGKELYYISDDGDLMAVTVDTDADTFAVGATTKLFQTAYEMGSSYDVQPDGERFVFSEVAADVETPISLIINWDKLLKR